MKKVLPIALFLVVFCVAYTKNGYSLPLVLPTVYTTSGYVYDIDNNMLPISGVIILPDVSSPNYNLESKIFGNFSFDVGGYDFFGTVMFDLPFFSEPRDSWLHLVTEWHLDGYGQWSGWMNQHYEKISPLHYIDDVLKWRDQFTFERMLAWWILDKDGNYSPVCSILGDARDLAGDDKLSLTFTRSVYVPVPEPATTFLLGTGLLVFAGLRRRLR